jgi:hypothetical protein
MNQLTFPPITRLPHYENTEVEILFCIEEDLANIDSLKLFRTMRVLRPRIPFEVVDIAVQKIEKRLADQTESKWFTELIFWFMDSFVGRNLKQKQKLTNSLLLFLSEDNNHSQLLQLCKPFSIRLELVKSCLQDLVNDGYIQKNGSITKSGKATKQIYITEAIAIMKEAIL